MFEYPRTARRPRQPSRRPRRAPELPNRAATPSVITILEPELAQIVKQAAEGSFACVQVASVDDAMRAVRRHAAGAVFLSPTVLVRESAATIRRLVTKNPGTEIVAVLGEDWMQADGRLLWLGACGIREVANLAEREGWQKLRRIVDAGGPGAGAIIAEFLPFLSSARDEAKTFFASLVRLAPKTPSAKELAEKLGLHPSTLVSRFFRAGLPGPKVYLAMTRLVYATFYFENPNVSLASVADHLGYSSPQSFSRHIRSLLGITAGQFRRRFPPEKAITHYVERLIVPYEEVFKTFDPVGPGPLPHLSLYWHHASPVRLAAEP